MPATNVTLDAGNCNSSVNQKFMTLEASFCHLSALLRRCASTKGDDTTPQKRDENTFVNSVVKDFTLETTSR